MSDIKKYCLLTNDVETTSIWHNTLRDKTGYKVLKEGMPLLLDLYEKYNIKSTFFFTGYIAKLYPEIVKMVIPYGHEVASHGLSHEKEDGFDVMPLKKQISHLKESKRIIEDISGVEVISFRAPALRVNNDTAIGSVRCNCHFACGRFAGWTTRSPVETTNYFRLPHYRSGYWAPCPGTGR